MPLAPAEPRTLGPQRLPGTRRLGVGERGRLAAEIFATYAQVRRELRRAPIEAVLARLRKRTAAAGARRPRALAESSRLGRAVAKTLALAPGDTRCLVRSLVLIGLLDRRQIPAVLVIGARSDPDFLAHAWVEQEGVAILDPGDGSFARLVEL
jgi:Transglutaminase-like superfamily